MTIGLIGSTPDSLANAKESQSAPKVQIHEKAALQLTPLISWAKGCAIQVHYYTADPVKEVPYAFGPAVPRTTIDEIRQEHHDRRCVDPLNLAADEAYAGFIGSTPEAIEAEHQRLLADRGAWRAAVKALETKEATATSVTIEPMDAGTPSFYMKPNSAGGYDVLQGFTSIKGWGLTYRFADGTKLQYRLECGFQPGVPEGPPMLPPVCPGGGHFDENGLCPKIAGEAVPLGGVGGPETHTVNYANGDLNSQGFQGNPGAAAAAAQAAANANSQSNADANAAAVLAAQQSGGGVVSSDPAHAGDPAPPPG
jgi:hypothetical protein